jgi:glycosyltransferase involved in cell wall biosynthesis
VTVVPKQENIRGIYAQTRVLIMPSEYESWGMVATEAMASGIPVISTGGPGLKENCGKAGTFISDRDDIGAWVKAIKALQDPKKYKSQSALARKRARELDPLQELDAAADFIKSVRFYSQSTRGAVSTAASL